MAITIAAAITMLTRMPVSTPMEDVRSAPKTATARAPPTWRAVFPNLARFKFLSDQAFRFYPEWDTAADITVAILRAEAGRDPHDKDLHDLIGELSTRSPEFRTKWAAHNVRRHGSGVKNYLHPVVGELTLTYEGMEVTEDPGLQLLVYTADGRPKSDEGLRHLKSWAASQPWASSHRVQHSTTTEID